MSFKQGSTCEAASSLERTTVMECPVLPALRAIGNHKRVQEESRPAPSPCPGREGADVKLPVLLVTLAGVAVLLLLYRLLQLRHRLKLARARHALEYYGFYHSATYRLRHLPLYEDEAKTGPALVQAVTPTAPSLPPVPSLTVTHLHPEQAPPHFIPPLVVPATPSLPLAPPVSQAMPPSPHLSWGACSDAELYSRIGVYRSSRLSSLSSQSRVILFEHSAL